MLEAAVDIVQSLQPSDGLMVWLGPHLAAESQSGVALDCTAVLTKGPRVSLSRWFSFYDTTSHHWKFWYTKLAILLYMTVQAGHATNAQDFPLLVRDFQGPTAPRAAETAADVLREEVAAGPLDQEAGATVTGTRANASGTRKLSQSQRQPSRRPTPNIFNASAQFKQYTRN